MHVGELVRVLGEAVHLQLVRELAEHGVLLAQGPHTRVRVVRRVLALAAKLFAGESIKGTSQKKNRKLLNLVTNIDKLQYLHWERLSMSLFRLPVQELLLVPKLCSPLYSTRKLCRPWTRVSLVHLMCHV